MAFLEVVTRCYKRPHMLADNIASLRTQTDQDYVQALLHDDVGHGVVHANTRLAHHTPEADWVWVLDDDDLCTCDTLVSDLKAIAAEHNPDAIIMRMDHGYAILPDDAHWECRPELGYIGSSSIVTRRDVWMHNRRAWASGRYESDFDFIVAVWLSSDFIYWHDCVVAKVQRVSRGVPE